MRISRRWSEPLQSSRIVSATGRLPPSPRARSAIKRRNRQFRRLRFFFLGYAALGAEQSLNFQVVALASSGAGTFTVRAVFSGRSANKRETLNELGPYSKVTWKQVKGTVQQKWGNLTSDDLDVIQGKRTELAGRLQERYGIAKDEAERQIDAWLKSCQLTDLRTTRKGGRTAMPNRAAAFLSKSSETQRPCSADGLPFSPDGVALEKKAPGSPVPTRWMVGRA